MPPLIKKNQNKLAGEIRRSQSVTTFGSGSLIDLPRFSGIISGIDKWKVNSIAHEAEVHERNLEKMLGKDCFYQVFSLDDDLDNSFAIPAYRFPTWYYCPECNCLDRHDKISKAPTNKSNYNSDSYCHACSTRHRNVKLIPSRFVTACPNGHLDEFPYNWWVHRNAQGEIDYKNHRLKLEYKGTSGGLGDIHVYCETCGASTTMAGCMDKDSLKSLTCHGNMPWLGYDQNTGSWYKDPRGCHAQLRVLQRSANNVYYPVNSSALTIPPWSEKLFEVMERKRDVFIDIFSEDDEDDIMHDLKRHFKKNKDLYGNDEEAFIKAAFMRFGDSDEGEITDKTLRCEEYSALCNADSDDVLFKTVSVEVPTQFKNLISQIKQVKKLREVMVLKGFRRILPTPDAASDPEESGPSSDGFAPLSRTPLNWLPAVEMFGEGIFINLNNEAVRSWEEQTRARYKALSRRHDQPWIGKEMFDENRTRYILLHTLSHLLIRQLSAQCGYATASIKEKIYSTYTDTGNDMCGILIYTSATDSDGSLGGLVREGATERICETLYNLLEESSWCSNDPICIDCDAQGYKGLNLSACHACTLLPETSCESLNCLLDRASVVGTPDNPEIGYFHKVLYEE